MNTQKVLLIEAKRDKQAEKRVNRIITNTLVSAYYDIHVVYAIEQEDFTQKSDCGCRVASTHRIQNNREEAVQPYAEKATFSELLNHRCSIVIELFSPMYLLVYDGCIYRKYHQQYHDALKNLQERYSWIRTGKYGKNGLAFNGRIPDFFDRRPATKRLEAIVRQALFL